jgi:hypothetical protein
VRADGKLPGIKLSLGGLRRCSRVGQTAFHSILVPVDGSTLAEAAIPYVLAVAERAHSRVQFVFVYQDRFTSSPSSWHESAPMGQLLSCASWRGPDGSARLKRPYVVPHLLLSGIDYFRSLSQPSSR